MRCLPFGLLFIGVLPAIALAAGESPRGAYLYHHDHILGTSLDIRVQADSETAALAAETRILSEIERLSRIFSTYDRDSEFSRWQRSKHEPVAESPELY